jgi:hypothetical protein
MQKEKRERLELPLHAQVRHTRRPRHHRCARRLSDFFGGVKQPGPYQTLKQKECQRLADKAEAVYGVACSIGDARQLGF